MKNVLKIFGFPRSGTNLLETILPLNFWVSFCQKREFNNYLGWKHARPKDRLVYNEISKITNESFYFIFSYRNKEEWIYTYKNKHMGSFEMPSDFIKNDRKYFIFNTPNGPEIYSSIEEYYDLQLKSYVDFCEENPRNTLLVNYNDFKNDQSFVLNLIKEKFNFNPVHPYWVEINKKIHWDGSIKNERF
jgi:hypothetical protein